MVIGDPQWRRELAQIIRRLRKKGYRDLAQHVLDLGRHCIATRAGEPDNSKTTVQEEPGHHAGDDHRRRIEKRGQRA